MKRVALAETETASLLRELRYDERAEFSEYVLELLKHWLRDNPR